ncbi:MAG: type II toxin-antitoxin system RelE/ParE family toxin [Longimicrobiaceae bacterium]
MLAEAARQYLAEIAKYYRANAGKAAAHRTISRILDKFRLIAETPGTIGQRRNEIEPGLRSFPAPPHVIYFRFAGETVEVARVLHGKRELRSNLFDTTGGS